MMRKQFMRLMQDERARQLMLVELAKIAELLDERIKDAKAGKPVSRKSVLAEAMQLIERKPRKRG